MSEPQGGQPLILAGLRVDFPARIALTERGWREVYDGLVALLRAQGYGPMAYRIEISTARGTWYARGA
jgi:hypothetical protein